MNNQNRKDFISFFQSFNEKDLKRQVNELKDKRQIESLKISKNLEKNLPIHIKEENITIRFKEKVPLSTRTPEKEKMQNNAFCKIKLESEINNKIRDDKNIPIIKLQKFFNKNNEFEENVPTNGRKIKIQNLFIPQINEKIIVPFQNFNNNFVLNFNTDDNINYNFVKQSKFHQTKKTENENEKSDHFKKVKIDKNHNLFEEIKIEPVLKIKPPFQKMSYFEEGYDFKKKKIKKPTLSTPMNKIFHSKEINYQTIKLQKFWKGSNFHYPYVFKKQFNYLQKEMEIYDISKKVILMKEKDDIQNYFFNK
jgi:hypothetical protein